METVFRLIALAGSVISYYAVCIAGIAILILAIFFGFAFVFAMLAATVVLFLIAAIVAIIRDTF